MISVFFEKCSGRPDCKNQTEILSFLRRKFIFTLQNENIFQTDDYTQNKISKWSKVRWYPINSQLRTEYVNQILRTNLELYDNRPLGELLSEEHDIFRVVPDGERPYEFLDNVHVTVVF